MSVFAEKLLFTRLAVPARFALGFVVSGGSALRAITIGLAAAVPGAFEGPGATGAVAFFLVLPFAQQAHVKNVTTDFAFMTPDASDLIAVHAFNAHPHRATYKNDQIAHFQL